jgi:hypothetical protein
MRSVIGKKKNHLFLLIRSGTGGWSESKRIEEAKSNVSGGVSDKVQLSFGFARS